MTHDPTRDDPYRTDDLDPGAFVGQRPERQAETIPGGISPKDERIAANSTQTGSTSGDPTPDGPPDATDATDDQVREAGQTR